MLKTLKFIGIAVGLVVVTVALFGCFAPVFGGRQSPESLQRIESSANYIDGEFVNAVPTSVRTIPHGSETSIMDWIFQAEDKNPSAPLPSEIFHPEDLTEGKFVWLGHATLLMKLNGLVIMTDPVFHRASPIPVFGSPFPIENPIPIDNLPIIDAVVISHDHYDHLDHKAVRWLADRVKHFFVPLGVKAHLVRWDVDPNAITEMDWYESEMHRNVRFTLAPARHFSGRGLWDRNATLWGSWIVSSDALNVYFSGDTGYSKTFKEIGQRYGPFDVAFIDSGAYNADWSQIHMMPEETVQASIDLAASVMVPIGWSKFDLALHPWDEPAIRLAKEADIKDVDVASPLIGEVFDLEDYPQIRWWERVRAELMHLIHSASS